MLLYDNGDLYNDKCPGQSEQFKGRVSHFQDELEQGNASITIRNTTRADSGEYRCSFSFNETTIMFHIKLVSTLIKQLNMSSHLSLTLLSSCCILSQLNFYAVFKVVLAGQWPAD